MNLICIIGKIASGKTCCAKNLMEKFNFKKLSYVESVLIKELNNLNLEITRENLQKIGNQLASKFDDAQLIGRLIDDAVEKENYVNDDSRKMHTINYLKNRLGENFYTIGIECSAEIRYKRFISRHKKDSQATFEDFCKFDNYKTEIEIKNVLNIVDYKIINETNLQLLYSSFEKITLEILKKWKKQN